MKNKIKQFSKGDFKVERPDIQFSETRILMNVGEGDVYEGSFLIKNTKVKLSIDSLNKALCFNLSLKINGRYAPLSTF